MAIARDAHVSGVVVGTSTGFSITVGSLTHGYALAFVYNGVKDTTGVTFAGTSMSLLASYNPDATGAALQIYGLANPPSGSQTCTVSRTGTGANSCTAVVATYSGVKATSQPDATATNTTTSTSITSSITTIADNAWVFIFCDSLSNNCNFTASTNTTLLEHYNNGADIGWVGDVNTHGVVHPAGSFSMSVSSSSNIQIASLMMSLVPDNSVAYTLTATNASFSLTGRTIGTSWARAIAAAFGSFTLTGIAVTMHKGYGIAAAFGSYALTGIAVTLNSFRHLTAAFGSYALTGIAVTMTRAINMTASTGRYILSGIATFLHFKGWTFESKSAAGTWGNESKNGGSWTNETPS